MSVALRRRLARFVIVAGLSSACLPWAVAAENWPGWRGPHGNGMCDEQGVPTAWSPEHNVAWKTALPGGGHSSPIVWGDRVFVTTADADAQTRSLICLHRGDGRIAWQKVVLTAPWEEMHPANSPASSTPATDGERVYVTFCDHGQFYIAAFGLDGALVWERRLGPFVSAHGFHSCPVVYDGSVVVNGRQDSDDAFLARLDGATGRTIWRASLPETVRSFSAPWIEHANAESTVLLSGAGCVVAHRWSDGSRVWRLEGPAEKTVSSLVAGDGLVFAAGGRDNRLLAIDLAQANANAPPKVAWTATRGIPYVPSPLLYDDLLHVVSDEGVYTCYRASDGAVLKRTRALGKTSASPIAVAGRLYFTDERGRTIVLRAGSDYEVLAENELGEAVLASPAAAGASLFFRGERHLYCIRDTHDSAGLPRNVD